MSTATYNNPVFGFYGLWLNTNEPSFSGAETCGHGCSQFELYGNSGHKADCFSMRGTNIIKSQGTTYLHVFNTVINIPARSRDAINPTIGRLGTEPFPQPLGSRSQSHEPAEGTVVSA